MTEEKKKIVVLGIGGGGCKTVKAFTEMVDSDADIQLAVADTDRRPLSSDFGNTVQIQLGDGLNCRNGCGADTALGSKAAGSSVDDFKDLLEGAELVVVTAGLGRGTGSGGVLVVARIAQQLGVPALFVVTLPFAFEGNWLVKQADESLKPLQELSDTVVTVHNDLLFNNLSADTPVQQAFQYADKMLARSLQGLTAIVRAEWLLTTDFTVIKKTLKKKPAFCYLGMGTGDGEDRVAQAVQDFIQCPLLGGEDTLQASDAAIITIMSNEQLSVGELRSALSQLQERFSDETQVLAGACTSSLRDDAIQITGLICQNFFEPFNSSGERPVKKEGQEEGQKQDKTNSFSNRAEVQGVLPLQEQSPGVFSPSNPTAVNGENLDIPTFQRRGIEIDIGS